MTTLRQGLVYGRSYFLLYLRYGGLEEYVSDKGQTDVNIWIVEHGLTEV